MPNRPCGLWLSVIGLDNFLRAFTDLSCYYNGCKRAHMHMWCYGLGLLKGQWLQVWRANGELGQCVPARHAGDCAGARNAYAQLYW